MNHTRTLAVAGALLLATACSSELTYDQQADRCIAAVNALPKGAQLQPRPKDCERMTEKDYKLIFANKILKDTGLTTPTPSP